jgi:hypothetical protein
VTSARTEVFFDVATLIVPNVLSVVVDPRPSGRPASFVTTTFDGADESTLLPFLRSSAPPGEKVEALLVTPLILIGAVEEEAVGPGVGVFLCPGWDSFAAADFLAISVSVDVLLALLSAKDGTGGKSDSA